MSSPREANIARDKSIARDATIARDVLLRFDATLDEARLASMLRSWAQPQSSSASTLRWQDNLIEQLIPRGASVLDLGCGEGMLLDRLIRHKQVRGQGVELESEAVFRSVERDVPVLQCDLDDGLKGFAAGSFDYVVLEETLQTLRHPAGVLQEMLRVGATGIVSFPNFGHWRVRLDVALLGRMPVTPTLPWTWHDTPNIHLLTLDDFLHFAHAFRVRIADAYAFADGLVRPLRDGDNLHAEEVLLVVQRG